MYGLINGKIYTVSGADWDKTPMSAMAIDDNGLIKAVGTDAEIKDIVGDGEIRDLGGNTVLPGMIDGHVHIPGTSFAELFQIPLGGLTKREETLNAIGAYVESHPEMDEYYGLGYNPGIFTPEDNPRFLLDEITDKPVFLKDVSCHARWLNSGALEKCGIDESITTESAGNIGRMPDGTLNGIFADVTDLDIPEQEFNEEQQMEALIHFMKKMNKWGYTSMMNVSPTWGISFYRYMEMDRDDITMRVTMSHFIYPESYDANLEELMKMSGEFKECKNADLLKMTTGKYMLDGVVEGCTAWLKEPYAPEAGYGPDFCAGTDWNDDDLLKSVTDVLDAGYQIHIHAIGDAASSKGLDVLAEGGKGKDPDKMRNVITHLQIVDPADLDRFAELGVIAALQPFWHIKEKGFYEIIEEPVLGKERAESEYPAKSFVDRGVKITSSGDYPISYTDNPLDGIRAGVTRNVWSEQFFGYEIDDMDEPETLLGAEERLSVKDMVEAYTINGAYEIFRDNETGSLEPGKQADYVILDKDIMTVNPLEINKAKVLETVFGGKTVYKE